MAPRLLSCLLLFATSAYSQSYSTLVIKADACYQQKLFKQSVALYKQAFRLTDKRKSSDLYNATCSAALISDTTLALGWLNDAVTAGYVNIRHMQTDTDLTVLRPTAGWQRVLTNLQRKVDVLEAAYDKPLQAELLTIHDEDQGHRRKIEGVASKHGYESKQMMALWDTINRLDSLNLLKVKAILDRAGWVGPERVGGQANLTLFLVIQHADLVTQQTYLPLMRKAVSIKKARPEHLALLEDRVALREGRKQLYGSQIGTNPAGQSYVLPLTDPDRVDRRRANVGLEPLANYVRQWGISWNPAEYKRKLPQYEKWAKEAEDE